MAPAVVRGPPFQTLRQQGNKALINAKEDLAKGNLTIYLSHAGQQVLG